RGSSVIRRFNYTGRKRIEQSGISVTLHEDADGVRTFDITLDLSGSRLPADGKVYVQAYYRTSWMRFSFGTVTAITPPTNRRLSEIDRGNIVYFRVLVVDEHGQHGRIIAAVDGIRPLRPGEDGYRKLSLLPVNLIDLGPELWRLDFEGAGPVLEVNNRIPDIE